MQDIIESTPELDLELIGYKNCRYYKECAVKTGLNNVYPGNTKSLPVLITLPAHLLKALRTWHLTVIQTLYLKSCHLQALGS